MFGLFEAAVVGADGAPTVGGRVGERVVGARLLDCELTNDVHSSTAINAVVTARLPVRTMTQGARARERPRTRIGEALCEQP